MKDNTNEEKCYTVYMHISPSGKRYIGITRQKPEKRWSYGYGYINNSYFWNAIQKYGWDNFKHEILFEGLTKEVAERKEIELISYYDTTNRNNGYNIDNGGNCVGSRSEETINKMKQPRLNTRKEIIQYTRSGKFVNIFVGIIEASKKLKISDSDISLCCNGTLKTAGGFIWRYSNEELTQEHIEWCNSKNGVFVCQYSKDGLFLKKYYNVITAEKESGLNRHYIIECCNGERGLLGGYIWIYSDFKLTDEYIEWCNNYQAKDNLKPVYQYTKNGELVKSYCGIHEAGRAVNGNSQNIFACCNNNQKTAYGYIWRYEDDILTDEYLKWCNNKNFTGYKSIVQYTIDGCFISEWNSIKDASSKLNIKHSNIIKCCKGDRKTAGGYIWRYADE